MLLWLVVVPLGLRLAHGSSMPEVVYNISWLPLLFYFLLVSSIAFPPCASFLFSTISSLFLLLLPWACQWQPEGNAQPSQQPTLKRRLSTLILLCSIVPTVFMACHHERQPIVVEGTEYLASPVVLGFQFLLVFDHLLWSSDLPAFDVLPPSSL